MCRTSLRARSRVRKAIPDAPPVLTAAAKTLVLKMLETAQAAVAKRHTTWLPNPPSPTYGRRNPHRASSGGLFVFVDEAVAAGRDGDE